MKRKNIILLTVLLAAFWVGHAQDTLRMMQYNLMYYTENSGVSDCNQTTNNLNQKDANLRTIFEYVLPDVFCVNEIGSNVMYADRILDNVININGRDHYRHGPLTNYSGGYIANMIFYNSRKLTLHSNTFITTAYRDINGYTMYYNSPDLAGGDTVFITFWIAHLKAGNYDDNIAARLVQTQRLMNRIATSGAPGNYVFSGDLNLYGAEEPSYQELINYSNSLYRFYDPIDREGHWNNNSMFADIHTQSTHSNSTDCFSSGGMDDRFDLILVSPYVFYGSQNVQVLPETYRALGQDGNRFNGSIVSPQNNSIPANVAQALYNQSDHLPVIAEFAIDATVGIAERTDDFLYKVVNPVRDNLDIYLHGIQPDQYTIEILSIDGKCLATYKETLSEGGQRLSYPFPFKSGMYLLRLSNSKHQEQISKLVK
ncbi:MAG: T9SS type A sorting domain-containing protein [Bacteroidales bacterium]|nr:T9SS type A sorting domain-containing protein [Bacteroidales bacterium]